jgi:hypothetical protein
MQEQTGFDPDKMCVGDLTIRQPVLLPPDGSDTATVPLRWAVSQESGRYRLDCVLPVGDYAGWTLDPTLTLQPDAAAGQDTYVQSNASDTNYGTGTQIIVKSQADAYRVGLLKFDISSVATAALTSATLSLYCSTAWAADKAFTVFRILAANNGWTEAGATWNHAVGTTNWAGGHTGCNTAETDYTATGAAGPVTAARTLGAESQWDVLAICQAWQTANYGLQIHETGAELFTIAYFGSSDNATAGYRPKLVVDYTLPGGLLLQLQNHGVLQGGAL